MTVPIEAAPMVSTQESSDFIWQRNVIGNVDSTSTSSISIAKFSDIDFHALSPIYCIDEVSKNKHHLNITKIPNAILQMAYLKLYIPLSMLTTSALLKIHSNNGLKYHKILFGNGAG